MLGVATLLALASCRGGDAPPPDQPAGGSGAASGDAPAARIVFTSAREGCDQLYVMNADGSGVIGLTSDTAGIGDAEWSPDGARLAFTKSLRHRTDTLRWVRELWVRRADSTGAIRLSDDVERFVWSPDGSALAFRTRDPNHIVLINADGSGRRRIGPRGEYGYMHDLPSWSPDGTRLAFVKTTDEVFGPPGHLYPNEIFVVNADGSGLTRLTNSPEREYLGPAWSPDGTRLAFARFGRDEDDDPRVEIRGGLYVMNADGSGVTRVANGGSAYSSVAWSPDGTRLVYSRRHWPDWEPEDAESDPASTTVPPGADIYVVNADGSGLANLTNSPAENDQPQWSPDGRRIAFVSDRDGNQEIYVMNADGSGVTRLTANVAHDYGPWWVPATHHVAAVADSLASRPESASAPSAPQSQLASLDSVLVSQQAFRAQLRRDSGTDRADSAFLALRRVRSETRIEHRIDTTQFRPWTRLAEGLDGWEGFVSRNPSFRWDSLWNDALFRWGHHFGVLVRGSGVMPLTFDVAGRLRSYEQLARGESPRAQYFRGLLDAYQRDGNTRGPAVEEYLRSTPEPRPGRFRERPPS